MTEQVCVAYLHDNNVSQLWHASYVSSLLYDMRPDGPGYLRGGHIAHYGAPLGFDDSRNAVVAKFLDEYTDCDWLWWVDSDMTWEPDALERLMEVADARDRPVVGGLCFAWEPIADDHAGARDMRPAPTVYAWDERPDSAGVSKVLRYPINEAIQVGATGSAFMLVHRSVFERVEERWGRTWYERGRHAKNKVKFGEDISFCLKLANLDPLIPVHVHTGVRTAHQKPVWVSEATYLRYLTAPPTTERVAVLVPVIDRPQNAAPFMQSLLASTGMADVYAVCEEHDVKSQEAWRDAGANLIVTNVHTFAEKINTGYANTDEDWFFVVGDDVTFHRGWLDEVMLVARLHSAKVVGTNDLGNPRVTRGEHATHFLVSREYVDKAGASWDGPGVVCHEGYMHWYVDDEIVTVAKQRGVWQAALTSIVEHNHPIWGKSEQDSVYREGQRHADRDRARFTARWRKYVEAAA